MLNKYVLLDIENPNSRGNSICAIAVITVEEGDIVDKKYSLINPEDRFDAINSKITGIDASQIQEAPTLKDYWSEISGILLNNVVVGHNITYDLSVLEKALHRYDIEIPGFEYSCTLELSRKYMNVDSYKLESLSNYIGYTYEAHVAINDALAAGKLFEYLQCNYTDSSDETHFFYPDNKTKEKIEECLITNLNTLSGIIEGITADDIVSGKEIERLKSWIEENTINRQYTLFAKIISELSRILEDNIVDEYEQIKLKHLVTEYSCSKMYCETTLGLQVLQGILDGIACDYSIEESEILKLDKWLQEHDYLSGIYPYDKILRLVQDVVEDGTIDQDEKNMLLKAFEEIINPMDVKSTKAEEAGLDGKLFCLSGEFTSASKSKVSKKLQEKGAIEKSGVSAKVDYLFVGGEGSDAWKFGKIGGKIAKALELQEKGAKIHIIAEEDMQALLG